MKKNYLYLAALAMFTAACSNEDEFAQEGIKPSPEVKMITETIKASNGDNTPATRADIDADAAFTWSANDKIAVHVSDGKYYTATLTSGASTNEAEFTAEYPEGKERDAFAVYPASIVDADAAKYGQSGTTLDVTLPASYTLAQVSGTKTPCPMIATNTPGKGWDFKQLCGLLRLTVKNIPATTKRLEIDFNGKQVSGNFSIAAGITPATSVITTAADADHDCIAITKDGTGATLGATSLVLNIPLPVGEYANITITVYDAVTDGNAILTTTRPFAYTASRVRGTKRTVSLPTTFRGYEVSTGILKRSKDGDAAATYSLTSGEMVMTVDPVSKAEIYALPEGCNPFEPAIYYNKNSSLNKYFLKWKDLRDELGNAENNINATSDKLPAGWQFPVGGGTQHEAASDWGKILFGTPKFPIVVNGTTVSAKNGMFALVKVTLEEGNAYSVAAGTYYGMFLLRDGSIIPEGYLSKIGLDHSYDANPLTEAQFNKLIQLGCLFISATGYYSELSGYGWRELNATWQYGQYWTNKYIDTAKFGSFYFSNITNSGQVSVASVSTTSDKNYQVVKLVKPVNP